MQKKNNISSLSKLLLVLLAFLTLGIGVGVECSTMSIDDELKVEIGAEASEAQDEDNKANYPKLTDQVSQSPHHFSFLSFCHKINAEVPEALNEKLSRHIPLAKIPSAFIKTLLTCIISPNAP